MTPTLLSEFDQTDAEWTSHPIPMGQPVRLIDVDIPLGKLFKFMLKIAVCAIPLGLMTVAAWLFLMGFISRLIELQ